MLQKPDLPDEAIVARLRVGYGLRAAEVCFLPLGADQATAVYRVVDDGGRAFFVKLRSRGFDPVGVAVPRLLADQGVRQVIPPLPTRRGRLWTRLGRFALVLYPFVEGSDAYASRMAEGQWRELGAALRALHGLRLPKRLARCVPRETFDAEPRQAVRRFLARAAAERFDDLAAAELAGLLRGSRERIEALLRRADELGEALRARAPEPVLCHGDVHAGNVLLGAGGALHVIDWDTLAYAPREQDFEQIDGGWGGARGAELFYEGYGGIQPDRTAIAYYRYSRMVEDLKVVSELLLETTEGGENRAQELTLAARALGPRGAVDLARELDTA